MRSSVTTRITPACLSDDFYQSLTTQYGSEIYACRGNFHTRFELFMPFIFLFISHTV